MGTTDFGGRSNSSRMAARTLGCKEQKVEVSNGKIEAYRVNMLVTVILDTTSRSLPLRPWTR
jgi:hypothetical protein